MPEENNFSRTALERLGVDPDNLGCVMLNVSINANYRESLDESKAYYSKKLEHVKGFEGQPHITLLYGLLFSAEKNRDLVDGVLEGWTPPDVVTMYDVDVFPGNDGDEEYGAIVLKMGLNHWDMDILEDANARLSKLPHVRGFYKYEPHVTIGYVQKDYIEEALAILRRLYVSPMFTQSLDYGS